jgi:hypothetical protein
MFWEKKSLEDIRQIIIEKLSNNVPVRKTMSLAFRVFSRSNSISRPALRRGQT